MDKKKAIIIGIIILIIACVILFILTSVKYDRIEITPNGTTIDVPSDQTKFDGEFESLKIWDWKYGILVTYNSNADKSLIKVSEIGFNTLNNIIKNGQKQDIDGFTGYLISADKLFEIKIFEVIKIDYKGNFYCIPLYNETTHDSIIICCSDKNVAAHMAKSVEYKNVYPDHDNLNDSLSTIQNIKDDSISKVQNLTDNLESKARNYVNRTF